MQIQSVVVSASQSLIPGMPQQTLTPFYITLILGNKEVRRVRCVLVLEFELFATLQLSQNDDVVRAVIKKPILLKIVSLGDQLLLNWVTLHSAQHEPQQLELEVSHYITSKSGAESWQPPDFCHERFTTSPRHPYGGMQNSLPAIRTLMI